MRFVIAIALALMLAPGLVSADFTLLDANFDDKVVGDPIGMGGPDLGEPISVDVVLTAIVQDTPFATPALEFKYIDNPYAGSAIFEFVGGVSVDVGNVIVSFNVIFDSVDSYYMLVREQGGWGEKFCDLYTDTGGNLRLSDEAGYVGIVGSYVVDQEYSFQFIFDTVNDTYDVLQDGTPLVEDRSHGIVGTGIGRIAFKIVYSAAIGAEFTIDDLRVTADEYTAAIPSSFSEVKPSF